MLLMLQNPHRYPGVMLPRWYRTARLGSVGCRKGAADGTLLHVRVGQAPINAGKASPVMAGASRAASSATGLVSDEAKHLNGKSRPQLIGLNLP